jgi:ribosomal protection tetracycline resistance protein
MGTLNIGILAHVDAGKTSLTERILYTTGVIRSLGSVDKGTTQTDTMELERARGITIKSAVVSFQLGDLKVNLIDTPGHADFVAEVERSLRVLDAVVLVISSVEGVQPQTRRLAQAIRAAGLPLLIFVNKIDRVGARIEPLLDDISRKLKLRVFPMLSVADSGTRSAQISPRTLDDSDWRNALVDALAETNEAVIEEFEGTGGEISASFLESEFRSQIARREITPVFFGSAITGAGVAELLEGVETLLPVASGLDCAATSGTVFKVARKPSGERIVYARVFAGELSVRSKVDVQRSISATELDRFEERITAIDRFVAGATVSADVARAGDIVCLHGLKSARIGDTIGEPVGRTDGGERAFPPPSLESLVRAVNPAQVTKLRSALEILADQDPLISLRQRNVEGEISVHLYGEVQKEVIADTLAHEFGVEVTFGPSQTICIERPIGTGEAFEVMGDGTNPFVATLGFRVEPGVGGSGIAYSRELGSLPLAFYRATEETVYETITQGLYGWNLTDAAITLTHTGFSSVASVAADFRLLTPLVIMKALERAGTEVCEPIDLLELEIPEDTFSPVCSVLIAARATIKSTYRVGETHRISCEIPSVELRGAEQQLPGMTRGDAGWTTSFAGYRPVTGEAPVRERVGANPLNRAEYLASVGRK